MNKQTKEAIKKALDWMEKVASFTPAEYDKEGIAVAKALYEALEQPAQEPVAWLQETNGSLFVIKHQDGIEGMDDYTPLYTHPHQWQELTDDEMDKVLETMGNVKDWNYIDFARAIEQALKEKNHG